MISSDSYHNTTKLHFVDVEFNPERKQSDGVVFWRGVCPDTGHPSMESVRVTSKAECALVCLANEECHQFKLDDKTMICHFYNIARRDAHFGWALDDYDRVNN